MKIKNTISRNNQYQLNYSYGNKYSNNPINIFVFQNKKPDDYLESKPGNPIEIVPINIVIPAIRKVSDEWNEPWTSPVPQDAVNIRKAEINELFM